MLGGGLAAVATPAWTAAAPAVLTGAGAYRSVRLVSSRTQEKIDTIYWLEGEYIPEALAEINWFMRDWRLDSAKVIDVRTLDIVAGVQRLMATGEPLDVISGYRTAQTNSMLRRRNRRVAKNSYHIKGMAADIRLKSQPYSQLLRAALTINGGGIGKYTRSNFVHVDSGPLRTWGS